jgi:predicted phage baseplate assembly protein
VAIEALAYRVGGGAAGNLPAGRLTEVLTGGPVTVRQPFGAIGGAPAESLDETHARALALLSRPARAITVADWEALALDVPGVRVGRASALAGVHPDFSCWSAPGVITVVVLPDCGDPPVPGPDFLAAVTRFLRRRRPLTSELHVVGPHYVPVKVSATLHLGGPSPAVAARAQAALDAFFDPLRGGPIGSGWPFGRGVLESDLLDVLARLPGVAYVDGLQIATGDEAPRCQNLALCPSDLVDSQTHQFVVVEA